MGDEEKDEYSQITEGEQTFLLKFKRMLIHDLWEAILRPKSEDTTTLETT